MKTFLAFLCNAAKPEVGLTRSTGYVMEFKLDGTAGQALSPDSLLIH